MTANGWVPPPEPVERGTRVVIPKGTMIVSDMRPNPKDRGFVAQTTHVVTVNHCSRKARGGVYETTVRWAGSGGYWREAFLRDVEVLHGEF